MSTTPATTDPIDLKEFEWQVEVRPTTIDDFDQIVAMQRRAFPDMPTWTREQVESQIRIFPEGQICVVLDGQIVASASSLIVDFDQHEQWHDWQAVSDAGMIRNHKPDGDTLYGIEIMVHPEFRGLKLARRLYDARKNLVRQRNLKRIIIAGRLPGYGE
ncbi:MAG: GNAT family N-acetyltransferase, partial [Planctomycetota bacterium]